jgi:hypothetical protein
MARQLGGARRCWQWRPEGVYRIIIRLKKLPVEARTRYEEAAGEPPEARRSANHRRALVSTSRTQSRQ